MGSDKPGPSESGEPKPVPSLPSEKGSPKPEPPPAEPPLGAKESLKNLISSGPIQAQNVAMIGEMQISGEGRAARLSLKQHFDLWSKERLRREREKLCFDPDEISVLVSKLQESRILILAGDPEVGKTSLALLVASDLWSREEEGLHETALCRSLTSDLRVDFAALTGGDKEFHRRILILKNIFASSNEDVVRFSSQLSASHLEASGSQLQDSRSYLILTADLPGLPCSREMLRSAGVLHEVSKPTADELSRGLLELTQWLRKDLQIAGDDPLSLAIEEVLHEGEALIIAELDTFSRLGRFVREYLTEVASGRLSLRDAVKRTQDLGHWLLEELTDTPEAWCSTVALTLCSAGRRATGISWFEVDLLRRALYRFIRRESRSDKLRRRDVRDLCLSEVSLKQARAEVVPSPFPHLDAVRFLDERYPDGLWQVLLGPGRGLVGTLVPWLLDIVSSDDSYLRQSAAQALGRIGQIDPSYITYPLIREWSAPDSEGARNALDRGTLLGHLYSGILGAREDPGYQQACLEILRWISRSGGSKVVPSVIYALRHIAMLDHSHFDFAMGILKEAAEKSLKIQWVPLREVAETIRQAEQGARILEDLRDKRGDVAEVRDASEILLSARVVAEPALPISEALASTLVNLLFAFRLQGKTFRCLLDWMQGDPENMGPLVTFLFLGRSGIASSLEHTSFIRKTGSDDGDEGSLLLESIRSDTGLAESLRLFLEAIHIHLRTFPGIFRTLLEEQFLRLLASWAREARSLPRLRVPVTDLLAQLFGSHDEELSGLILRLAQEPPASPDRRDLHILTVEAITVRRMSRAVAS